MTSKVANLIHCANCGKKRRSNNRIVRFGPKDRVLISRALGELAASLGINNEGRLYTQAVNVMKKWDGLPKGTIQLPMK